MIESLFPNPGALVQIVHNLPRAMNAGGQSMGVTVVADGTPSDINSSTPYGALFWALSRSTVFGVYGTDGSQFMPVPKGTLRIVVAAKADPIFRDAPATDVPAK
jgi:hypothetical protein